MSPTAKTTALAASSHTLPVIRTTANTTVVISAAKCRLRGSMSIGAGPPQVFQAGPDRSPPNFTY